MRISKAEGNFYLIAAFLNLDFQRGLFVLYLLQIGFSEGQVGIFQSALFFANVFLEIPSGLLADKYGRKRVIAIGFIGLMLNGIGFLLFSTFIPFLLLFAIYGLSIAMSSGADRALIYDNLIAEGRQDKYVKVIARAQSIGAVSLGLSMLSGGFIFESLGWAGVYLIFASSKLLGAIIAALSPEYVLGLAQTADPEGSNEAAPRLNIAHPKPTSHAEDSSVYQFYNNKNGLALIILFFSYGLFDVAVTPLYIYGQKIFLDSGLSISFISIIYGFVQMLTAFMYIAAAKVSAAYSLRSVGTATTMVVALLILTISYTSSPGLIVVAFVLAVSIPAFYETAYDVFINDRMLSKIRASGLSVANLVNSIAIGISFPFFGAMLTTYGTALTLQVVSGVAAIGVAGLFISTRMLLNDGKT